MARGEINRHPDIQDFLDSATERLIAITDELTAGLGIEAVKLAKARGATAVDAVDVLAADAKLNHPQRADQFKAWLFGVGALLIGGAFSAAPTLGAHAIAATSAVLVERDNRSPGGRCDPRRSMGFPRRRK